MVWTAELVAADVAVEFEHPLVDAVFSDADDFEFPVEVPYLNGSGTNHWFGYVELALAFPELVGNVQDGHNSNPINDICGCCHHSSPSANNFFHFGAMYSRPTSLISSNDKILFFNTLHMEQARQMFSMT